jgi:hypothetical protein
MQITLELPEDIAQGLESRWKDLPRGALESLALEGIALMPSRLLSYGDFFVSRRVCRSTLF